MAVSGGGDGAELSASQGESGMAAVSVLCQNAPGLPLGAGLSVSFLGSMFGHS